MDNEYAVYNTNQQYIEYLVEFTCADESVDATQRLAFKEAASARSDVVSYGGNGQGDGPADATGPAGTAAANDLDEGEVMTDEAKREPELSGLVATTASGAEVPVPLKGVHVRGKLYDLVSEIVVLQHYSNDATEPIEAKYVFPLNEMCAVCGFEAFINGKHIVGVVKEKEEARREYREAIAAGHGAYLMEEEKPDVFTVSVGNLPPAAEVLIKITYVAELVMEGPDIVFTLPATLAPSAEKQAALARVLQGTGMFCL